jgi:peptide deformylase
MTESFAKTLRQVGVVPMGDPVLARPGRTFTLPAERAWAAAVVAELTAALDRICAARPFPKGSGIAAPQLGRSVAAAVVRPRGMADIVLLNPQVTSPSKQFDVQWEGCLSFFDLRGKVVRPRAITVSWDTLDGHSVKQRFTDGAARMVSHEFDHLNGVLYLDRLADGTQAVDIEDYCDTHSPWRYM